MIRPSRDHRALAAAWTGLPPRDRLMLTLLYFEGLTAVETARALGCSVREVERTVELRLTRLSRMLARTTSRRAPVRPEARKAA